MPKKTHSVNILMDDKHYEMLATLAEQLTMSRGATVRLSIRRAHAMICAQRPTCANGAPCFVPQMHPQQIQNNQQENP